MGVKGSVPPRMLTLVTEMGNWGQVTISVETEGFFGFLHLFVYLLVSECVFGGGGSPCSQRTPCSS